LLLLDAAIPVRAQEIRVESGITSNFPDHFQDSGLGAISTHTSGDTQPGTSLFPLTGLTTVAPSPKLGRRSVSPASSRIISLVGAVRRTFQRGCLPLSKTSLTKA